MVAKDKSEDKVSEVAQRLKQLREKARLTVRGLAGLLEMEPSSYRHYEVRYKKAEMPMALIKSLKPHLMRRGISESEIMALAGAETTGGSVDEFDGPIEPSAHIATNWSPPLMTAKLIPVYRMGWVGATGSFDLDWGKTVGVVPASVALSQMADVYALIVDGTTMEPRYYANERVYATKSRPPSVGWFVVVRMRREDPAAPQKCYLLRLVERTESRIICEQLNPQKKFTFNPELVELDRVLINNEIDSV